MSGNKLFQGVMPFALLFFIASTSFSQVKLVEKSGKTPKWINATEKGYMIETGTGASISEAKDRAIAGVKESIIKAVAEQITAVTEDHLQQTREGNNYKISGSFSSSTRSRTARMPFVTGISESKVESYYWEKLKDKKTGNVTYNYHVKYPFSREELGGIILDFEMLQKNEELKLNEMDEIIGNAVSLDELAGKYHELQAMLPQLEGGNKMQGDLLLKKLQSLLNSVSFIEIRSVPGHVSFKLVSGTIPLQAILSPVVKSNCAGNFKTTFSPDSISINYTFNGCFENQLNKITINYPVGDISIKHDFPIDIASGNVEFSIAGGFHLEAESSDSALVRAYKLNFGINSKFSTPFLITRIILEIPGVNPLRFDNLSITSSGTGAHGFSVQGLTPLKRSVFMEKQGDLISGSVTFLNSVTNESVVLKLYNEKLFIHF